VKELTYSQVEIYIKDHGRKARKMAKEFINGLVAQPTKVNLKREKFVDKEFIFMRMVKNIKET
jgi:hypothetical protein